MSENIDKIINILQSQEIVFIGRKEWEILTSQNKAVISKGSYLHSYLDDVVLVTNHQVKVNMWAFSNSIQGSELQQQVQRSCISVLSRQQFLKLSEASKERIQETHEILDTETSSQGESVSKVIVKKSLLKCVRPMCWRMTGITEVSQSDEQIDKKSNSDESEQ